MSNKDIIYWPNKNIRARGKIINGKKEGEWTLYNRKGEIEQIGKYNNDEQVGIWVTYNPNETINSKGISINGKREGMWDLYYSATGSLNAFGEFLNDKKHGEWKIFNQGGMFREDKFFDQGKEIIIDASEKGSGQSSIPEPISEKERERESEEEIDWERKLREEFVKEEDAYKAPYLDRELKNPHKTKNLKPRVDLMIKNYIKELFDYQDGSTQDFVLINFMRVKQVSHYHEKKITTNEDLLGHKLLNREFISNYKGCFFFSLFPIKVIREHFKEKITEYYTYEYKHDETHIFRYVFIVMSPDILCNLPGEHMVGVNISEEWGYGDESESYVLVRDCNGKFDIGKYYLDYLTNNIIKDLDLYDAEKTNNIFEAELENPDITSPIFEETKIFLKDIIGKYIFNSEIFPCHDVYDKDYNHERTKLKFNPEDVIAFNLEKSTVEDTLGAVFSWPQKPKQYSYED